MNAVFPSVLSRGSQCLGAVRFIIFLVATVIFWLHVATGQQSAIPKLTLTQIEQLVSHGVPDSTMAAQIQKRGLAFTPTPATLEELRTKGTGPLTIAAIETTTRGGPNSGSTGLHGPVAAAAPRYDASAPMLSEARQTIPTEVTAIFRSLDEGNPQSARQFLSAEVANNAQLLDSICRPFTYKAHYIEAIIERPGELFEVRLHALFTPLEEKLLVLTFRPNQGLFLLVQVGGADDNWLGPEKESAVQAVRDFIYAAKAQRADIISKLVGSGFDVSPYTENPCWQEALPRIVSVNGTSVNMDSLKGLKVKVYADLSIQTRVFTGNQGVFWVDRFGDQFKVVAAAPLFRPSFILNPAILFNDSPVACRSVGESFFAPVEGSTLEHDTLRRFGLTAASLSPAVKAALNPVEKAVPTLAETMQFIHDRMKEQGQVDYVSTTSNRNNPSIISRMTVQSAEYNVVADLATCTLHVEFAENDSLETSLGGKTFAAGTYDQHSQVAATVPFKEVEGITIESRQDSENHSFVAIGHPELSATVVPSVFVVQLSASKPVFSAHLSTTKGSETPQVSDNTGMLTELLFRDEEMANRVAKSVRQAVELCGSGKKEPF
jgi:hypothetical protein